MKIQQFSCLSLLHVCLILNCINLVSVSSQCLNSQKRSLIELKNTIKFNSSLSTKISSWNQSTDCCSWEGVDCNTDGYVIGLYLRGFWLSGPIPHSIESLTQLVHLDLSSNEFTGPIPDTYLEGLNSLDLSSNKFEGSIPKSFFALKRLRVLDLSNNHLNDTLELAAFGVLLNLFYLNLSYNNLSITINEPSSFLFPQLEALILASCNLKHFPKWHMNQTTELLELDLSDNQIGGEIPSWIWNAGFLNLSHNELKSFQEPYVVRSELYVLDLHANKMHGKFPVPGESASYVDYSFNHFNSSLPDAICKPSSLEFLDLSSNNLSGTIPSCLTNPRILRLGNNNLSGNIPERCPINCRLESLDLHGNHLEGKIPKSLGNCRRLEFLDLGNNLLSDTFPCFLMNKSTNLRVLSLRSNKLHGNLQCRGATTVWSKLQIFDIASNYFIGYVPRSFFQNWTAMIANEDGGQSKRNYLHEVGGGAFTENYFYKVTVVIKGNAIELEKILSIFTSIDLSDNRFSGEIPNRIGELKQLYSLNMSHNAFTGSIPTSFGNLRELGALDLSVNHLAERIPIELAGLTYLGFLNLSYNELEGMIPIGQLQTFTKSSFEGNKGLCGIQLNTSCVGEQWQGLSPPPSEKTEIDGFLISFEVGIVVGLVTIIAPLVLSRRWSKWYFEQIDRIIVAKVYQYFQRRNQERKRPIRRL